MNATVTMERPQRWDYPFDDSVTDADIAMLLRRPEFSAIQPNLFPKTVPLEGVLRNDCRILKLTPGDIVIREGDYGSSAFLVMRGTLRVISKGELPSGVLGRVSAQRRGFFDRLSQLWRTSKSPEVRDTASYDRRGESTSELLHDSLLSSTEGREQFADAINEADHEVVPDLKDDYQTVDLKAGAIFGEIAALGRVPRTATVYAHSYATLLEVRWQGLSVLRKYDQGWRAIIDTGYRRNQLKVQIKESTLLSHLPDEIIQKLADRTLFESYGTFEWNVAYKTRSSSSNGEVEPVIAREGDYTDGLIIISGGFARVSKKVGNGQRTVTYLRDGDHFGMDELYATWKLDGRAPLETSLTALGYVNLLRIPANALEELVFPSLPPISSRLADSLKRPLSGDSLLEWAVEHRYINGTKAMLIDLEKCVRCDDCVRACAATHGGNPRFIRRGESQGRAMVAHACMHCVDPVCMIGCPTGAIHRSPDSGAVVINDIACIGCGTCANSCPYDNIQLVEIRDKSGRQLLDPRTQTPILKATKCDLCFDQLGGPACERACPHDALKRVDFQNS